MNRVALFAHFDAENEVKPYVTFYIERLRRECSRIVFVSTASLSQAQKEKLYPYAADVFLKDNVGWDFGMWQHALERVDLGDCDELVLANTSVFGPIFPLGPIFDRMGKDRCDFWGMTDNFECRWHLQSYFLVLKRRVLGSEAFRTFFRNLLPYRSKGQVVLSYEVGFTAYLAENGFAPGAFAATDSWAPWVLRRRMDLERRWNPTLFYPEKLLSLGMPFVKASLLRDNLADLPLEPIYRAMSAAGYDLGLIPFDRAPKSTPLTLRARARRLWQRVAVDSVGTSLLGQPHGAPAPPDLNFSQGSSETGRSQRGLGG
jgi:lipopolysaccharide biosynthesis protein